MAEVKKTVSKKAETQNKSFQIPELIDFLKAGSHFGHKKSAWNPRMKKYIYEERNGIHIIDLVKTREVLQETLPELDKLSKDGNILIVGTKGQAASIVQKAAEDKGLFYINKRWMGGLFTNFDGIKKSVQELIKMEEELAGGLEHLVKKERLLLERDIERLNRIYSGIKFMDKLPKAVVVIDSKVEKNAIKEARTVGIPIFALIDTNCNPDLIDYPIPANDDSLKSISLFVDLLADVVKGTKPATSLIALRRDHEAKIDKIAREYAEEKERKAKMEAEDRERMKALREGRVEAASTTSVVRVVKKEKDIDAEIEAAEKVKEESRGIEELGLGTRTENALKAAKIKTASDLRKLSEEELLEIKGVGAKAAKDILKAVK